MAVHTVTYIASSTDENTGDEIAASVGANPVVVRNILGKLKKAGIVDVRPGVGGAYLLEAPQHITLLDIYHAVDLVEEDQLFHFHHPEIKCDIGRLMDTALRKELAEVQLAMEERLKQTTISQLLEQRE